MPPSVHLDLTDLNYHLVPQSTLIRDSLTWYWETTLNASCNQLYPFDETSQLRQRRSKFDSLSTYLPCRASSIFTNDIQCRSAAIWALADFAPTLQPSSSLSPKLFGLIALQVFTNGKNSRLRSNHQGLCVLRPLAIAGSPRYQSHAATPLHFRDGIGPVISPSLPGEVASSRSRDADSGESLKEKLISAMQSMQSQASSSKTKTIKTRAPKGGKQPIKQTRTERKMNIESHCTV